MTNRLEAVNFPLRFSNTDTSLELKFAVTRSGRPSPLMSCDTRALGPDPAAYRTWVRKVPSPLPSNTDTSLELKLAVTRSGKPSPLTSRDTRALGEFPVAYRTWDWNVPSPLPSN